MKKILSAIAAALLALASPAQAADSTVTAMTAAGAFTGTELLYVVQSAADRKGTPAQMATYVYGLMTGDCTMTGSAITCTKINGVTFPSSGTSGGIPYFSAGGAISSSAALTANLPVIGGGAGVAPSSGTRSGNTTGFATFTGTVTGGTTCAQWDANGNLTTSASSCGGTVTIASGTSALGTSAIASGVCATAVTTAAAGTATTDVVLVGWNGDPTAVTGYAPTATGMLTIISYPSANNVNHKVCNNTASSITPGAITLNWRVVR